MKSPHISPPGEIVDFEPTVPSSVQLTEGFRDLLNAVQLSEKETSTGYSIHYGDVIWCYLQALELGDKDIRLQLHEKFIDLVQDAERDNVFSIDKHVGRESYMRAQSLAQDYLVPFTTGQIERRDLSAAVARQESRRALLEAGLQAEPDGFLASTLHALRATQHGIQRYHTLLHGEGRERFTVDRERALERLGVSGDIPETLNPHALRKLIEHRLPAVAIQAARSIKFRPFTEREAIIYVRGIKTERRVGGMYNLNTRDILINTQHIKTSASAQRVIAHEFGHAFLEGYVHLRDLMDFDLARGLEPVDVSPNGYISFVEKHFPQRAPNEDFAESFGMFYADPAHLRAKSPGRYAVMSAIDRAYQ